MRLHFFALVGLLACAIAPPATASPLHSIFRTSARSDELRSTSPAVAPATDAAIIAASDANGDDGPPLAPGMFSATLTFGFGLSTFAPPAAAPIDPGRLVVA